MSEISPHGLGSLDDDSWPSFVADYWEQKPVKLPFAAANRPVVTSEVLFRALVRASDACRHGDRESAARWTEQGRVIALLSAGDIERHGPRLPASGDGSLLGYADRVARVDGYSNFLLHMDNPYAWDEELWHSVRDFAARIYEFVGFPGNRALCDTYVGKYDATPFGVHLDGASNFTFGVHGYKTLYLWEPEYYEKEMRGAARGDYRRFVNDAIALTVGPGECIYWPARYWHIADSGGEFSVTMNIAFYLPGDPNEQVQQALHRALDADVAGFAGFDALDFDAGDFAGNGRALPRQLDHLVQRVDQLGRSGTLAQALQTELMRSWLRALTCLGFPVAPKLAPQAPLGVDDAIRADDRYPIVMAEMPAGRLGIAANGRLAEITHHPGVVRLIERLNGGNVSIVERLMAECAGDAVINGESLELSSDDIRAIVTMLYNWRAVNRTEAEHGSVGAGGSPSPDASTT